MCDKDRFKGDRGMSVGGVYPPLPRHQKERASFLCKVNERDKIRAVLDLKQEIPGFGFKQFDVMLDKYIDTHQHCPLSLQDLKHYIRENF